MLEEMMEVLLGLPRSFWNAYALQNDPVCRRLSFAQRNRYAQGARQEAAGIALCKKKIYKKRTISEILASHGISVQEMPPAEWGQKVPFAIFEEPSLICINRRNAECCQHLLEQSGLAHILEGHSVEELLLTHELYHWFASKGEAPYARKNHVQLWKFGPFEYQRQIPALEEVGAMTFAQEFLDLGFDPFVLDLPLTFCHSTELAQRLYDRILNLWQTIEGELHEG